MLELIEEPLDPVSELIGLGVMWDLHYSVPFGRNDRLYIGLLNHVTQRV
jgi:hypothetical protein